MANWAPFSAHSHGATLELLPDTKCVFQTAAPETGLVLDGAPYLNNNPPFTMREKTPFMLRCNLPSSTGFANVSVSLMTEPLNDLGQPTRLAQLCPKHNRDPGDTLEMSEEEPNRTVRILLHATSSCCNVSPQQGIPRHRPFWLKVVVESPHGDQHETYSFPFKVTGRESYRKALRAAGIPADSPQKGSVAPAIPVNSGQLPPTALNMDALPRSQLSNKGVPRVLNEHEAMNHWLSTFGREPVVLWTTFREAFPILSHPRGNLTGNSGHLLRHLLTEQPSRLNVAIERVSQLFQFIGPCDSEEEVLSRLDKMVYPLVRNSTFFGFLDRTTSLKALENSATAGAYVVRFSSHPEGPGSLTIDYTQDRGAGSGIQPAHTRVHMHPNAECDIVVGNKSRRFANLPDLLHGMSYLFKEPVRSHTGHVCAPEYVNPSQGTSALGGSMAGPPSAGLSLGSGMGGSQGDPSFPFGSQTGFGSVFGGQSNQGSFPPSIGSTFNNSQQGAGAGDKSQRNTSTFSLTGFGSGWGELGNNSQGSQGQWGLK